MLHVVAMSSQSMIEIEEEHCCCCCCCCQSLMIDAYVPSYYYYYYYLFFVTLLHIVDDVVFVLGGLCVELECVVAISVYHKTFLLQIYICPDRTMSIIHSSLESSTAPARHPIRESLNEIQT